MVEGLLQERVVENKTTVRHAYVTEDDLIRLPAPVQRYLRYSGVVGKPWITSTHLKYTGKFRMAVDKPWMPISAVQVYTTHPPGFVWKARFKMFGLPVMQGSDAYQAGQSHMQGKLFGLFKIVDGQGEEVNQGTMIRYLQEMSWFPAAYLGDYITWQAVDDHAADVSFHDNGKTVTGRMYFDDEGRLLTFTAQRYGDFAGHYQIRTWATPATEYAPMAGLNLPIGGMGVWHLPSGDFPYINIRLTEIKYNEPVEAV